MKKLGVMARVTRKHEIYKKAVETFFLAIKDFNEIEKFAPNSKELQERLYIGLRNSVIKSFEYCCDLCWEYVRIFLEEDGGIVFERYSPKYVFKKAFESKSFSKEEVDLALEMIDSRNESSHVYKEEIADFLVKKAPEYYGLMKVIVDRMVVT